jgi:hypothetical protein
MIDWFGGLKSVAIGNVRPPGTMPVQVVYGFVFSYQGQPRFAGPVMRFTSS